MPTFNDSQAGGAGAVDAAESQTNQWETRFGMKVDALAAFTYILGPISGEHAMLAWTPRRKLDANRYESMSGADLRDSQ